MKASKNRETIAALAVLLVIVSIVTTAAVTNSSTTKQKPSSKANVASNIQLSSTPAAPGSLYKNGVFQSDASYDSPGGPEKFHLSITLKNDVIADTSAISGSMDATSRLYQEQFIAAYKQVIVGKKISDVPKIGALGGSSLTCQGFNEALEQIKQEAKQS